MEREAEVVKNKMIFYLEIQNVYKRSGRCKCKCLSLSFSNDSHFLPAPCCFVCLAQKRWLERGGT
jgi:hypothetical protein